MSDNTTSANILVVDDSLLNLNMVKQVLRKSGYTVFTAEDGHSGLEAVRTHHPDLVILDVMMPGMDGFEVCQSIREDETIADTKVLMLTAHDTPEEQHRSVEAGADGYMTKPYQVSELRERIKTMLA